MTLSSLYHCYRIARNPLIPGKHTHGREVVEVRYLRLIYMHPAVAPNLLLGVIAARAFLRRTGGRTNPCPT